MTYSVLAACLNNNTLCSAWWRGVNNLQCTNNAVQSSRIIGLLAKLEWNLHNISVVVIVKEQSECPTRPFLIIITASMVHEDGALVVVLHCGLDFFLLTPGELTVKGWQRLVENETAT